jgi:hypothetical protein
MHLAHLRNGTGDPRTTGGGLIAAGGGRCVTTEEGAEIVVSDQHSATDSH